MQSNWKQSFDMMLDSEGGFQDDINDSGNHLSDGRRGCTNLGVTQAAWEEYVGHKVSTQDMRNLTPAVVEPFYRRKYWDACRCNDLPTGVDYLVFDFAVNSGVGRSAKTLQSVVGTTPDGAIGPLTLTAVGKYSSEMLINLFSIAKEEYYRSLNNPHYEQGWLNRVLITRQHAMGMVG
jgi:lysozyme family protein